MKNFLLKTYGVLALVATALAFIQYIAPETQYSREPKTLMFLVGIFTVTTFLQITELLGSFNKIEGGLK